MRANKNKRPNNNVFGSKKKETIISKDFEVLASLQNEAKENNSDSEFVWLQKYGDKTVLIKMTDMSNKHLQNAFYSVQHKMNEHFKKTTILENIAQQIEIVAKDRNLTLKDIDDDYFNDRKEKIAKDEKKVVAKT